MAFPYTQELIDTSLTYQQYRHSINDILQKNSKPDTYGKYLSYVNNNVALMNDYDKSYQVSDKLKKALSAAPNTTWLVLTEGWCGDAAFSAPLLALLEKVAPENIKVRFLLRDDNFTLMDAHLTDGGRSIPKVIVLNDDLKNLGSWGP